MDSEIFSIKQVIRTNRAESQKKVVGWVVWKEEMMKSKITAGKNDLGPINVH